MLLAPTWPVLPPCVFWRAWSIQVDSLIRIAEAGTTPQCADAFVDAEMASADLTAAAAASRGFHAAGGEGAGAPVAVAGDVRTISGLVSLTIDCLEDGLSDEATILQRHMRSPDFGHPLLRLSSPSGNDPDYPHIPDDPEVKKKLVCFVLFFVPPCCWHAFAGRQVGRHRSVGFACFCGLTEGWRLLRLS